MCGEAASDGMVLVAMISTAMLGRDMLGLP
jgi:hypothetical protein